MRMELNKEGVLHLDLRLLPEPEVKIIHTDVNNVTHIEVHPNDILKNLKIIKQIMSGDSIVEDENE